MIQVCFVCLGNICRSPTAHGIMMNLVKKEGLSEQITIDSAGTGHWHVGEAPDARTQETARGRGIALTSRARQFQPNDFDRFQYILAMDNENLRVLHSWAPDQTARSKVSLFLKFHPNFPQGGNVPDPYYGGEQGFEHVFDLCEAGCLGLLADIRKRFKL